MCFEEVWKCVSRERSCASNLQETVLAEKNSNIDQSSVYDVVNGKKVYLGSSPPGAALLNLPTPSAVSVGAVRGPSCF